MPSNNLILGTIRSYTYDQLYPFIASLRNTSFDGDVYFLTNSISQDTKRSFEANQVNWVEINYRGKGALNSWARFWPVLKHVCTMLPHSSSRKILKYILPLQTVRFLHYKDFLLRNINKYDHVLLTDVRDVFFQNDPFRDLIADKIQCYEEYSVLGDEVTFNVPWIKQLFGEGAINSFRDKKILCSGTIIGPIKKMIELLEHFESLLKKANDVSAGGSDQGIYNYLIRTILSERVDIKAYGTGQIITVTSLDEKSYRYLDNYLVNSDNLIYPVIHQYDRLEAMVKNVNSILLK